MILPNRMSSALLVVLTLLVAVGSQVACTAQEAPSALSGLSSSEIFDITDGRQLKSNDVAVDRLLFRIAQTSRANLNRFAQFSESVEFDQLVEDPRDYRCHVFSISGTAKSFQRLESSSEGLEADERGRYLVHVTLEEGQDCLVVLPDETESGISVPSRWKQNVELDEPVRFEGFFLAVYDFHNDSEAGPRSIKVSGLVQSDVPVFVAKRIEWTPVEDHGFSLTNSELLLARNGVDIGALDRLRLNANGPMRKVDSLPFYQLLAAANGMERKQFPADGLVDFEDCLQSASKSVGQPMQLQGTVRRITEVQVSDIDAQTEFGIDRYYQLHLFLPLDQQEIVIRSKDQAPDSDQVMRLDSRFPMTVCCRELPDEKSAMEGKLVSVQGFFFKLWNYESELSRTKSTRLNQISPLIIALPPTLIANDGAMINWWISAAAILTILIAGLLLWFYGPGDSGQRPSSARTGLPDQIEIPGD